MASRNRDTLANERYERLSVPDGAQKAQGKKMYTLVEGTVDVL
jgi:hypothetical protein